MSRNIDKLPTIKEIGTKLPNLPKVKIEGGYEDVEEYAETYYQLTRADFVSMVQKGLEQFRNDKGYGDRNPSNSKNFSDSFKSQLKGKTNPPKNYELAECNVTFGHQVPEMSGLSWQVYFDSKKVDYQ